MDFNIHQTMENSAFIILTYAPALTKSAKSSAPLYRTFTFQTFPHTSQIF